MNSSNLWSKLVVPALLLGSHLLNGNDVTFVYSDDSGPLFQNNSDEYISTSTDVSCRINLDEPRANVMIFNNKHPQSYQLQDESYFSQLTLIPGENFIDVDSKTPIISRSRYRIFYLPNIEIKQAKYVVEGATTNEETGELELSETLSTAVNIPHIQLKLKKIPQHNDHSLIVYDSFNNPLPITQNEASSIINLGLRRGPNNFKIVSRIKNQVLDEKTVNLFLQKAVEVLPNLEKSPRLERAPTGNWISRSPKVWLEVNIPGIETGSAILAVNDFETRHQVANNRFEYEVELSPNRVNTIKAVWESSNTRYLDYIQISYFP